MKNTARSILTATLSLALFAPASASLQIIGGLASAIPANNNFSASLAFVGVDQILAGANLLITEDGTIEFFYHGAESGFDNRFVAGSLSMQENGGGTSNPLAFSPATSIGIIPVSGGQTFSFLGIGFEVVNGGGTNALAGAPGFAVYSSSGGTPMANHDVLYFGFDDSGAGPDKDYDDMIVSAVFTPNPATTQLEHMPEAASIATWIGLVGMAGWFARRASRSARAV